MTENRKHPRTDGKHQARRVFLSYGSEDTHLARQLAETLRKNGIETWWDEWEIRSGDSIRHKIDEGIKTCTHFLVLLTPQSIDRPWVTTEMDAGFVHQLAGKCKFIPVRYELPIAMLPLTLKGVKSPEIKSGTDIGDLISDIYELSKKPALGEPPAAVRQAQEIETGYPPAVQAVAKLLVEKSKHGRASDPSSTIREIAAAVGSSLEDAEDAVYDLEEHGFLRKISKFLGKKPSGYRVSTMPSLFVEFDRYFMGWNAEDDAIQIATDMVNDKKFTTNPEKIVKQYGWSPRRLNPALKYLVDEEAIHNTYKHGIHPLVISCVRETSHSAIRRFLQEHRL